MKVAAVASTFFERGPHWMTSSHPLHDDVIFKRGRSVRAEGRTVLSFDIRAFTLDALVGPALIASDTGASGALESIVELGVRF